MVQKRSSDDPTPQPARIVETVRGREVRSPKKNHLLGVFNDDNRIGKYTKNAPSVNKVFGTKIPALYSSRAWAIHTEVIEKSPDRFALLERTAKQVFDLPAYKEAYVKTGAPLEAIQYGDRATCTRYAQAMVELANEYRPLLSAKTKG